PVRDHRAVAGFAYRGPQVAIVPDAVAVEIDVPAAGHGYADFGHTIAVEIAGERDRAFATKVRHLVLTHAFLGQDGVAVAHLQVMGAGEDIHTRFRHRHQRLAVRIAATRITGVDHTKVPTVGRGLRRSTGAKEQVDVRERCRHDL